MNQRFNMFQRSGIFYCEDRETRRQTSLRTRDRTEALAILTAKNESFRQPLVNLQIARAYLTASDPEIATRTWQSVMDQMQTHGGASTQTRCTRAMQSDAFDVLRDKRLMETTATALLGVLNGGKVSVIHYLRRLHNLALALGWLPVPVLSPKLWPKPQYKPKRGITAAEHQLLLAAERDPERNLFYQLLWEIGASQSDAASLTADNIDLMTNTLTYFRMKTGEQAQLTISKRLAAILNQLPTEGSLFPKLSKTGGNTRAADFCWLCKRLKIKGVSLHSYRYAWAQHTLAYTTSRRCADWFKSCFIRVSSASEADTGKRSVHNSSRLPNGETVHQIGNLSQAKATECKTNEQHARSLCSLSALDWQSMDTLSPFSRMVWLRITPSTGTPTMRAGMGTMEPFTGE